LTSLGPIRRFLAAILRRIAAFASTLDGDRARLDAAAVTYRVMAERLDPQAPCVVCGVMVSVAIGDDHVCSDEAMARWVAERETVQA
jgi:hypothetical protein